MIAKTNIDGDSHSLNFSERLNRCFSKNSVSDIFQIVEDNENPKIPGYDAWVHRIKIKY